MEEKQEREAPRCSVRCICSCLGTITILLHVSEDIEVPLRLIRDDQTSCLRCSVAVHRAIIVGHIILCLLFIVSYVGCETVFLQKMKQFLNTPLPGSAARLRDWYVLYKRGANLVYAG
jgi:hypothetical protein